MKDFTSQRTHETKDELWFLQHFPIYTLGLAGRMEHVLNPNGTIPILKVDRGGQVTYHAPGQLVVYTLVDLRRRKETVRSWVRCLERIIIDLVASYGVSAYGDVSAPGVYIEGKKIASLGLRVQNGSCYHGLALNVHMDLSPFLDINPCGYSIRMTQLSDYVDGISFDDVQERIRLMFEAIA
jgi:lipoyl(octanoyl) transferase